jgi:uncharacterized protein with HEPN domain
MLSDRARLALFDMRDNIRLCRQFIEGCTLDIFRQNRMIFYAVTRALEIVSEASGGCRQACGSGIPICLGER